MNEYLFYFFAGVASAFSAGFVMGAAWKALNWKPKSKLVDRVALHKAKSAKTWAPVERRCATCDATYWADSSVAYNRVNCPACRKKELHYRSTLLHLDRHP